MLIINTNLTLFVLELRAAIPIIISEISPEEDDNALPSYEDAWKSAPYDPQQVEALIARGDLPPSIAISAPNEAAIGASRTLASTDTDDEGDSHTQPSTPGSTNNGSLELPWQGIDISRVPSYTTAIRSNRLYSFSGSLPGYDSVIAVPGRSG